MKRVDALIVGGGPAGTATALMLRRLGKNALVVERSRYERDRFADTLAPQAKPLLEGLGISAGEHVEGHGTRSAWDDAVPVEQNALFNPFGAAWHVERRRFDAMLAQTAAAVGATVWTDARLRRVARKGEGWRAEVEHDGARRIVHAGTLVDATGRSARVARAQGAARLSYDRLIGISALLQPRARPSRDGSMLLLEAAADGWWYSVPLPDGRLLACHVTDADVRARRGITMLSDWRAALARAPNTEARSRGYRAAALGAVRVRPASVGQLTRRAGPGWIAVGDAAASLDPLSGLGLTRAIETGIAAAQAIAAGDGPAFDRYDSATGQDFAAHLRQRADYYGRVERFAGALFWRRRRPIDPWRSAITLDPLACLAATRHADRAAAASLEGLLPRQDIARLRRLCAEPREAHQVVRTFRTGRPDADDRAAIVALQVLIEDRLLRVVPGRGA